MQGMNEYLKAEKEAGRYEAAQESERGAEITEKCFARKSRQVAAKRTRSSSSESESSRKKAWEGIGAKVPSQGVFRSEMGLEKILSGNENSEEEKRLAPPLIQSQRSRGPAISVGTEVAGEPAMVG